MIKMICPLCDYTKDVELAVWGLNDGDLVEHTCEKYNADIEGYLAITWEILDTRLSK
jgi:hypothetical protein